MSDPTTIGVTSPTGGQRERILAAATEAFAARGYHHTSIEEICSESGVDSRSILALFPDKYELFHQVVLGAADTQLRAAQSASNPTTDARQARAALLAVIEAVARSSISSRASGGFYRGESRYLRPAHLQELRNRLADLRRTVREPLQRLRPCLSDGDAELMSAAALSAIASITIHPTTLPAAKMMTLLTVSAMRILESDPADRPDATPGMPHGEQHHPLAQAPTRRWQPDTSPRGTILATAIQLFHVHGFNAVTIDDIANAIGIIPQQVTQHFPTTSDLLRDACLESYRVLDATMQNALTSSDMPGDILAALSRGYVRHSFADTEMMSVFLNDARNLVDDNQEKMLELQRHFISQWVRTLWQVRPELSSPEAQFLVFAGLSIVADLGRLVQWENDPTVRAKIEKLVLSAMANRY
ncbi:TetR family transcriptional regulator [Homoserinimonas aerilata]|uniref:TetR family transcriptional regulator n=1 Tax=Homoserinimonas aerilata TaxID=1162970 RepID=A0A542YJM9_9MICO|nr:TetR/AcrR family transcriptional regulator [Homoserinimonas aerilata]TQL48306.1 TetR family transcriptional regulator [Homoserinimonas aerilata]